MTRTQTHYEGCWKVHHACAVYRIGQLESKLDGMRAELRELWDECDKVPHAVGCDPDGDGYCTCARGDFNSFLFNVCGNHDVLQGGE